MKKKFVFFSILSLILIFTIISSANGNLSFLKFPVAHAAALTAVSDTMTRLKISTAADHTVQFTTPTGIAEGNTVILTFATGFDISTIVTADVTMEGAAVTSVGVVGQVMTITAAAGNVVVATGTADIVIGATHHVTNPGTAGSYKIAITGTFADSGFLAVAILDNEQVVVTGSVDPSFSFTINDVAVGFSTITTAAVRYATADAAGSVGAPAAGAFQLTNINSNTANGYSFTTKSEGSGAAAGLYCAAAPDLIEADAIADIVLGTDGYAFCGKEASGGALAIAAGFACETGSTVISRTAQAFATDTTIISGGSLKVDLKAGLSGTTKPGTYTDTLTIIGTANF